MDSVRHEPINVNSQEIAVLADLLESERARLLVEIRHTHHRAFRNELQQRLTIIEVLADRCGPQARREADFGDLA